MEIDNCLAPGYNVCMLMSTTTSLSPVSSLSDTAARAAVRHISDRSDGPICAYVASTRAADAAKAGATVDEIAHALAWCWEDFEPTPTEISVAERIVGGASADDVYEDLDRAWKGNEVPSNECHY